jgi:putative phage-type endonuclease
MNSDLMNYDLINIIDLIEPDQPTSFTDEEALTLYETCLHIMEEFIIQNPTIISDPDFDDIFEENIEELLEAHFEDDIFYSEEDLEEILEQARTDFFKDFMPIRSYPSSIILEDPDFCFLEEQITILKGKPQPVQRTKEWYEFRHNLITASNAYKAFESQSTKNQLIYEKCQPKHDDQEQNSETDIDTKVIQVQSCMVNVNTSLHHGQKYEPLSVMVYEDMYKTKVDDFGCIQHETFSFIGASPDGINVDKTSLRYGRMLEIKNIVNREIDGIPKKEYWIQMQLQMEVCDLDECDFLETKFTEYDNGEAFYNDTSDKRKGVIMYFHTKTGTPFYKYMPFDIVSFEEINAWQEQMIDLYQSSKYNYIWLKDCYWKLDIISCVLVCRNRQWFKDNVNGLAEIWATIVAERVSGFEHRAPNRKSKVIADICSNTSSNTSSNGCLLKFNKNNSNTSSNTSSSNSITSNGCLLNFNKDSGKITVVKKEAPNIIGNLNLNIHPFFQSKV